MNATRKTGHFNLSMSLSAIVCAMSLGMTATADPIEATHGLYSNGAWLTDPTAWEGGLEIDSSKDYIISGRYNAYKSDGTTSAYNFRFASPNQVFNGGSLQFGDPSISAGSKVLMIMAGTPVTFNKLKLGAGSMCSWVGSGNVGGTPVEHVINGAVEVVASAANPYRFLNQESRVNHTYHLTGAFAGGVDTGLKISVSSPLFRLVLDNAAGFYGDLAVEGSETTTASVDLNQAAMRTLTTAEGLVVTLTDDSSSNTIGSYVGAAGAKLVYTTFPGTALTVTNSLAGGITIDLPTSWTGDKPTRTAEAWTNNYPILTLAAGVEFSQGDVVINDLTGLTVQSGIERSIRPVLNADGSTTYYYHLCQPYPLFFSVGQHGTDPSQSSFWTQVDGRGFVSPFEESASQYAYCENTSKFRTNIGTVTCRAGYFLLGSSSSFMVLSGSPTFENDGLIIDGGSIYNWTGSAYTISGKVTVMGSVGVGKDTKAGGSISFAPGTLCGDESAVIGNTSGNSQTNVGLIVKSAENYRGSINYVGAPTVAGHESYVTLGDTGTSSLKAVTLTSNMLFKAFAATDRTTVGDLTLDKNTALVPAGNGETMSCLTVTGTLQFVTPLKIACSNVVYPEIPEDAQEVRCAVLRWPKGAAYGITDFVIDNTGAQGRRHSHRWKVWDDGEYTCFGVERQRTGIVLSVR